MNKLTGLIVSGVLLLVVAGVIVKQLVFPSTDTPIVETSGSGFMEVIEVNAKISDVLGATPSGADDAAPHYARAVELYFANYDTIEKADEDLRKGEAQDYADALKTLEEIRRHVGQGAKQASMNYLAKHASGKLQVSRRQQDVERLGWTIDRLDVLGDYYIANKRFEDANAIYRDMLVAGWHMIEAHSHMHMALYGQDVAAMALRGMSKSIESGLDKTAASKLRAPLRVYLNALNEFRSAYSEKAAIFNKTRLGAGDMWNIAENDKDRSWRVQAILGMSLIKFTHEASKTTAARNNEMIEKFLNSEDPLEKMAAQAAKAFTEIDFNQVGMKW